MCAAGGRSWDLNDESVEPLWQLSDFVQEDFMLLQEIEGRQRSPRPPMHIRVRAAWWPRSAAMCAGRMSRCPDLTRTAWISHRSDSGLGSRGRALRPVQLAAHPAASIFFPPDPHAANKAALKSVSAQLAQDPSLAPSLLHMRVERQTLRRLPETRAVAFSIHTYSDPLSSLLDDPEALRRCSRCSGATPRLACNTPRWTRFSSAVIAWLETRSDTGQ